jgi:soluble lytic murein transglycosylase
MSSRFTPYLAAALVLLSLTASGSNSPNTESPLVKAAEGMRRNDFRAAFDAALRAPAGGARDLLAGVAAYRLGRYDEALAPLASAAETYPLLAEYALWYRADALQHIGRSSEALPVLARLKKDHPQTTLLRKAELLEADALFAAKEYRGALAAYEKFIEKYASGNDALSSLFNSASCRENLCDLKGAAATFRKVWLAYPGSPLADRAEENLKRLYAGGEKEVPYTAEELYRRGVTLYDLRKYRDAIRTFDGILSAMSPAPELKGKILLRKGQALYRTRNFADAEAAFAAGGAVKGDGNDEFLYWQAKAMDRIGRDTEAAELFLKAAAKAPKSETADDALFEAALIRKGEGKKEEALRLLAKVVADYPLSSLKNRILWEDAWTRYLGGDQKGAQESFRRLTELPDFREKGLYWLGRSLQASGNIDEAAKAMGMLAKEFPYGFYTVHYLNGGKEMKPIRSADLLLKSPLPSGYDKTKALISLGMYDDARRELSRERKKVVSKPKGLAAIARLYAEMGDFNTPYALAKENPRDLERELYWSLVYPKAYAGDVTESAAKNRVPEGFVYSVIRAESGFSPTVVSPAGAVGLMQLMPTTAKAVAGKEVDHSALTTPQLNIRYGVRHLKDLREGYRGNPVLTAAAYNAGSGSVARWQKKFGNLREDEFIENIPFAETREYVKKVVAGAEIYEALYRRGAPAEPAAVEAAVPAEKPAEEQAAQPAPTPAPVLPSSPPAAAAAPAEAAPAPAPADVSPLSAPAERQTATGLQAP